MLLNREPLHSLAEHKLRRALHQHPNMCPASEYIDAEMEGYTNDYVDFVLQQVRDARQSCPDPQALIEQRLDFSIVPGGFGTGDAVIIAEPRLHIIDLKYGMGVLVEAEQGIRKLMLYALVSALRIAV